MAHFSTMLTTISTQALRLLNLLAASSSHPLFSIAATSALLLLLYTPALLPLLLSPALLASLVCLSFLLRFGSAPPKPSTTSSAVVQAPKLEEPRLDYIEWERRGGPLEVIYEEYEGEEDEEGSGDSPYSPMIMGGMCFTDSDTGSEDDDGEGDYPKVEGWEFPKSLCFRWEDEAEAGMIEIELEEDNLIEIDISAGGRRSLRPR